MDNYLTQGGPLEQWSDLLTPAIFEESLACIIGIFSAKRMILYANAGMKALLGLDGMNPDPLSSLVNPTFDSLLARPRDRDSIFSGILTVTTQNDQFSSVIVKVYRREEEILLFGEFDVSELAIHNREMVALNREITNLQRELIKEKKQLETTLRELRETQAMLVHAEKMSALGQLTAGVAHEINNPIGFVLANFHNLDRSFRDIRQAYHELESIAIGHSGSGETEEIRSRYDLDFGFNDFENLSAATCDGILRVKTIVEQLRNFSHLHEAVRKTSDVAEGLKSTLALVDGELRNRGIAVSLDLGKLGSIECYPAELNQVFMNIILNAIQAMEQGGRLGITGRDEGDKIVLEFSDTGTGIAQEDVEKVFEPFYTTKAAGNGTGLGLAISRKIITEGHHGSLTVRSTVGKGSTFRITIPRSDIQ